MHRRNAIRNKRKPISRAVLLLELLEDRTLLSTLDGSFQDIMLTNLRADPAFAGIDGHGVGVAVIDSGVYAQNPDLQQNFVHWFDAITNQDSSYTDVSIDVAAAFDPVGHGSHVAGIAASSNSDIGVAPAANLIGIRGVPGPGDVVPPNRDPIATGLQWVVAHHQDFNIRVVNLSVGNGSNLNATPSVTSGEAALIAQLQSLGVTVVAASGNNYADFLAPGQTAPAVFSTIGVADVWAANAQFAPRVSGDDFAGFQAVEQESAIDRVEASSQRSSMANQLAAPGQDVYSTWNGAGGLFYNTLSGTSMSAPMVSGAVALMQQAAYSFGGRYLLPSEVLSILKQTADTVTDYDVATNGRVPVVNGQPDFSQQSSLPETGLSLQRINVYHALQAVEHLMQTGSPPGDPGDINGNAGGSIPLPDPSSSGSSTVGGSIGSDGQNQVGNNDVDLYQLNLSSPDMLNITVGPAASGVGFDSYLRLFNSSGQEIGANDDVSPTDPWSQLLTGLLQAGLYYIGVSSDGNVSYNPLTGAGAANGTAGGDYQMTMSSVNPDPDGTLASAVNFGGIPAAFAGNIGSDPAPGGTGTVTVGGQDVDMYQAVAPDNGSIVLDTKTDRYGNQGANVFIRVFDNQGNEIASGGGGGATDNHLEVSVTTGEVVYVAVSDAANKAYDPKNPYTRTASGPGGLYDLFIDFANGDENGTPGTATPVPDNGSLSESIGTDPAPGGGRVTVGTDGSKDVDVYSFTPATSGLLDLKVAGQGGFIPFVSLLAAGQSAAIPASVNSQGAAEIIDFVQPGLKYYLAITGRGNGDFHWYSAGSGSGGVTGAYNVTTSLLPFAGSLASITNGSIQGNPLAVTNVTLGSSTAGTVGTDGNLVVGAADVDLYKFVAPATQTVAIGTNTSAEGSSSTFLRFFDANGTELAYNGHANGSSTNSLLVVAVTAGQTYYVGVNGYSANARDYNPLTGAGAAAGSTGNYLLTLSGPPTSQVSALPAFSGTDFIVSWSGTPAAAGPAVAKYDVFVSDNGNAFAAFVTGTAQTSATFHGSTGHSYSFFSVATDQFGNRQPTPAAGQAATRVDTTPPGSSISGLPAFSPTAFPLAWSGADDQGGSGVATYDVYVSDNGGTFTRFLTGTANTSATFQGQTGHSYAFYSVATDRLGNRQGTPSAAQSATTVDGIAPTSSVLALPPGSKPDFLVSWSGSDAGGSGIAGYDVFVSDSGGPFTPFVTGTAATSAVFHGDDGHGYAFYSVATDRAGNRQATPAAAQAATNAAAGIYVTGADAGGGPDVKVFNAATGQAKFNFFAYDAHFTGGVRVAVGDVNGDGFPDVICAAGPGGGPNISVFDGRNGLPLAGPLGSFFAFDPRFTGGLYVAAADVNGDGFADIVCGADAGGGPNVTVFSGKDGTRLQSFFPFDPHFTGGVRVASGDVNGDRRADIIAAAGPGGGPQIRVFHGADATPIGAFFAFEPNFSGGVYVSAGDVNGDGLADVVVAAGPGGGPQVRVFSGADFAVLTSYFAYNPAFGGGVRVATVDCNDDGRVEIVTVAGPGGGPDVRTLNPLTMQQVDDFFAYDMRFSGGLYVAGVGS